MRNLRRRLEQNQALIGIERIGIITQCRDLHALNAQEVAHGIGLLVAEFAHVEMADAKGIEYRAAREGDEEQDDADEAPTRSGRRQRSGAKSE